MTGPVFYAISTFIFYSSASELLSFFIQVKNSNKVGRDDDDENAGNDDMEEDN